MSSTTKLRERLRRGACWRSELRIQSSIELPRWGQSAESADLLTSCTDMLRRPSRQLQAAERLEAPADAGHAGKCENTRPSFRQSVHVVPCCVADPARTQLVWKAVADPHWLLAMSHGHFLNSPCKLGQRFTPSSTWQIP